MTEQNVIPKTMPEAIACREEALTHYDKSSTTAFRIKEIIAQLKNFDEKISNLINKLDNDLE
jgi:hypothetical protein